MSNAEMIREMMQAWNKIMAAAKSQFPSASEEELFRIASSAMNHALKIK
jgi:hypothetical protein